MKKYELMYIIKPTLTEDEIKSRIAFIAETLTKNGATIDGVTDMGVRDLAYKIEKHQRGYYVVVYYTAPGAANQELERVIGITEDIIRFIVIKYEKKVELEAWENMVKKANGLPAVEKKLSFASRDDRKFKKDFKDNRYPKKEYKKPEGNEAAEAPAEDEKGE
jgi:small subunit ribosomal protein S6